MKYDSILDDPKINSSNCHVPCFCGFCEPGEYYQCKGCLRGCAWCFGGSDELYSEYCDDCWHEQTENLVTVVIQKPKPNVYINK